MFASNKGKACAYRIGVRAFILTAGELVYFWVKETCSSTFQIRENKYFYFKYLYCSIDARYTLRGFCAYAGVLCGCWGGGDVCFQTLVGVEMLRK